jgi:hypothetical protein
MRIIIPDCKPKMALEKVGAGVVNSSHYATSHWFFLIIGGYFNLEGWPVDTDQMTDTKICHTDKINSSDMTLAMPDTK